MTEDELKTKACFRAATFGASHQLADGPGPLCIGSACAAYREEPSPAPQWVHPDALTTSWFGWQVTPDPPSYSGYVKIERNQGKPHGFCGLAGRPA